MTMRALALAGLALLLAGCWSEPTRPSLVPSASSGPSSVAAATPVATASPAPSVASLPVALVTIETRGGHCRTGPCGRIVKIEGDGTIHEVMPTDRVVGQIPKPLLDALWTEIEQANYPLIQSRPFSGECPTAYDGQETVYTFHVPSGDEEIASCTVALDENHPLFLAVAAALALESP
jgi:hypothetical protein